MTDLPEVRVLSRSEFETMVLDDLNRPPGRDPAYVIEVLLIRDGGICGLCGTAVDSGYRDRYDPARPQGDHIIETKRAGGPHTWENLRLTHGFCNAYRNNFPAGYTIPVERVLGAFEQAVLKWENPHVFLPKSIAWDQGLIADYGAKLAAAETELREQVTAGEAIAGSARAVAHWGNEVRKARTHLATLERRIENHMAKLKGGA